MKKTHVGFPRLRSVAAPVSLLILLTACADQSAPPDGDAVSSDVPPVQQVGIDDWHELSAAASDEQLQRGKSLFQMCASCHGLEEGEISPAGPSLYGMAGRRVGGLESYPYTQVLTKSGKYWTVAHFREFITSPQEAYPGTGMAYAGIKAAEDRDAIAAYIASRLPGG